MWYTVYNAPPHVESGERALKTILEMRDLLRLTQKWVLGSVDVDADVRGVEGCAEDARAQQRCERLRLPKVR